MPIQAHDSRLVSVSRADGTAPTMVVCVIRSLGDAHRPPAYSPLMLEMRPICEARQTELGEAGDARSCSFE